MISSVFVSPAIAKDFQKALPCALESPQPSTHAMCLIQVSWMRTFPRRGFTPSSRAALARTGQERTGDKLAFGSFFLALLALKGLPGSLSQLVSTERTTGKWQAQLWQTATQLVWCSETSTNWHFLFPSLKSKSHFNAVVGQTEMRLRNEHCTHFPRENAKGVYASIISGLSNHSGTGQGGRRATWSPRTRGAVTESCRTREEGNLNCSLTVSMWVPRNV